MMEHKELEPASKCSVCGLIVADLDTGFSPGLQGLQHTCGGIWEPVWWNRAEDLILNRI